MIARSVRRQMLLTTTMLVGAIAAYGRSAYGQQVCVQQGVTTTFLCDNSSGNTQDLTFATTGVNNIDVITGANFDVDTVAGTGGNAITITGNGAISYLDYNASPLTAGDTALHIEATGDDGGTPGSVTVSTNGVLQGDIGIDARNYGSGALSVTANGDVTASGLAGIATQNFGGDLTVATGPGTTVEGGLFGVQALNFGSGALTITVGGDVAATLGSGIAAVNFYGSGLTVTTDVGTTVNGTDSGIATYNYSGTATITANGDVTGGQFGINARAYSGSDTLAIIVNGTVTSNGIPIFPGLSSDGIDAQHLGGGPIEITIGTAGSVTGNGTLADDFAIDLEGGPANVIISGTLNGGAGGAIQFDEVAALADRLELHPTASIDGTVFAGPGTDTLAFAGTGDGAFDLANIDTQYQDFETFEVDSGVWTFSGATTVPFSVNGGTMTGTGTFGGLTVNNGGVLAPGNAIGTMTVNGSFVLGPGAIFEVEVNTAGAGDKVIVNGTVNLTGSVLRVLAANGNYSPSTDYLIIDNDGSDSVVGTFASVTSNLAFLTPSVIYNGGDGNDVVLTLERVFGPGGSPLSFCSVATSRNQCNVALALDQFPTNNALFLAVLNQTAAGARQAFDALSGEIHATVSGTLADDSRYVRETVLGRLMQASHTGGNTQVAALAHAGPQVTSLDANAMALGYGSKSLGEGMPAYEPAPLAFWTRAYGAWGDFDGDGNAATADRDLGGFVTGMDAQVSGSWRAGLATGASFSNVSVSDRYSSADVESYTLGGYIGGMAGAFALRVGGMWAWNEIDTSRAVVFPGFFEHQKASYDADTGQLFGEVAYPTQMGALAVEPFAGLALVSIDGDSFRERGGALASLRGSSTDQDVGYSTLGLRAATTIHWGTTLVTPHVSAAWQHAFDDVTPDAALAFASTGIGFTVFGVPLAQDSALIDAGLDFALGPNTTAGVSYTGQFGDGVSDNGVKGRFTWLF